MSYFRTFIENFILCFIRCNCKYFYTLEDWTGPLNYYRNLPFYRLEGENLLRIDVRCLLINGKTDESVPLETIVKSTEYVEKYYLKIIEDAGHYPHQENPEMVNKALVEFLSGKFPKNSSMFYLYLLFYFYTYNQ